MPAASGYTIPPASTCNRGHDPILLLDGEGLSFNDEILVCAARYRVPPAVKADRVERSCRCPWIRWLVRGLLPTVVLIVGFGRPAGATAASVSSAVPPDDHSQFCKCGGCSGVSCCCGPHRAKTAVSPEVPRTQPVRMGGGPCLNSSPCGDSPLPSTPVPGPPGKMATLAASGHAVPDATGHFLPSPVRCVLPARRASRLDDPPESLPAA